MAIGENSDAIFKHPLANTIFGGCFSSLFLILMFMYFGTGRLFKDNGLHCGICNILCCPCPGPCIYIDANAQMICTVEASDAHNQAHSEDTNEPNVLVTSDNEDIPPPPDMGENEIPTNKATSSADLIHTHKAKDKKFLICDRKIAPPTDPSGLSLEAS